MVKVQLTDEAKEDLKDLDGAAQKAVIKGLKKLRTNPDQYGEPLGSKNSGNLTGFRKLVVGKNTYRIIYLVHEGDVADDVTLVVVWVIADRADDRVYQLAIRRLETMKHRELASELEEMLMEVWGQSSGAGRKQ
jgi:mRNA interferase RelE/StbE